MQLCKTPTGNNNYKRQKSSDSTDTFQYVPLTETLKLVLCNKEVMDFIENEQPSNDGLVRSYVDGQAFKKHAFLLKYNNSVRLRLYFDEFLTNNALGSKTHDKKIAGIDISLGNLPDHLKHFAGNVYILALA